MRMAGKARWVWGLAVSWNEPARAYKGNISLSVRMMWARVVDRDYLRNSAQESWDIVLARLLILIREYVVHLRPN